MPLVTQVMKAQMVKLGMTVNNHLCEHFPYSRQELYHLVRVGQIKTFEDLLARHGKGMGCDICKPVAASVLASIWNEFVLKPQVRFQGQPGEQWTMFFHDPSGNPIEIKGFRTLDGVYAT